MEIREEFPSVPGHQVAVIIISGDISSDPLGKIRRTVGKRMAFAHRKFILDITDVRPIVTNTVNTLLPILIDIKKVQGVYWLVSSPGPLDEVLRRTKLTDQFPYSPSREEAIRNLTSTAQ